MILKPEAVCFRLLLSLRNCNVINKLSNEIQTNTSETKW